jgi:hypothetical protein
LISEELRIRQVGVALTIICLFDGRQLVELADNEVVVVAALLLQLSAMLHRINRRI